MQMRYLHIGLLACIAGLAGSAGATEDTDTPGAGKWEINLGVSATRSGATWEYGLPDADINYGLGERMQLLLGGTRTSLREPGVPARTGTGSATVGLKWRLVDQEQAGFALALFPQYSWNPSSSAERRGIVEPGTSLVVPLLLGVRKGDTGYYGEFGRTFGSDGGNAWLRGIKVLHRCRENVECRVELQHEIVSSTGHQTTASAGFKWALNETYVVVAGIGRDVGRNRDGARGVIVNLGLQILK